MDVERLRQEYPHIQFRRQWTVDNKIAYVLGQCQSIVRAISNLPIDPGYHSYLKRVSLKKGAQATTAIEGNTLTDEEIAKVAEGQSLPPSKGYQQIEVRNILDSMNDLFDEVIAGQKAEVISPALLQRFHHMIGKNLGEHFDAIPGRLRTDQRIVGSYRCPRPEHVPQLVEAFCDFLARDFNYTNGDQSFDDAVIQAIVAHVYLEWIHPFGDGNGRTGRLLEFYVLLRAGNPDIASHIMSNHYNETRSEYYRQLDKATKSRDLTNFILYALGGFRDGLQGVLDTIQENQFRTAWKSHIYEVFAHLKYRKKNVFKRKRDLILAMPMGQAMSIDALAIITPGLAREYAKVSERTLQRDLDDLVTVQLVRKTDHDHYVTNHEILQMNMAKRLSVDHIMRNP